MATKTQKSDPNQGKNATSYNLMIAVERHNGNPRLGLFDIESGAELELSLSIENPQAGELTPLVCLGNALTPMVQAKHQIKAIGIKYNGATPIEMTLLSETGDTVRELFTDMENNSKYGTNLPAWLRLIGLELVDKRSAINAHPLTQWDN